MVNTTTKSPHEADVYQQTTSPRSWSFHTILISSLASVPLSYNSLLCGVALSCPNPFPRDLQQKIARLVPTATQKLPIQENFFQVQVNAICRSSAPLFALINEIRATVEEYSTNTIYRALHLNRNSAKTIQIKKLRRKQRQRG